MKRQTKGAVFAAGFLVAVSVLRRAFRSKPRYEPWEKPEFHEFYNKILILGGGFAGYNAAKKLCELIREREDVGVMLVARDNYLTFWPMVPGVVAGEVDIKNIAQPLRRRLIHMGASFRRAQVEKVDLKNQVVTAGGTRFAYDHLVLALGAQPSYFGIPGVEKHAINMRGIPDAVEVRNRVIERFEEAALQYGDVPDPKLTFVVIGAGATGVETAAQLHVLIHEVLGPEYPNVASKAFRIYLLDALPHILPELDPGLRRVARGQLAARDVEVVTNALAEEVTASGVKLKDGRHIGSENVIWTAGARPHEKLEEIGVPLIEKTNGAKVDECLRVEGYDNVWAIGDNATIPDGDGGFVPPNAQAAVKEGQTLAKNVLAAIDGGELEQFQFKSQGQLIDLGSQFAVNDVFGVKFSGWVASIFWRTAYLVRLESPQTKVRQAFDWLLGIFANPTVAQIHVEEDAGT